jgi:hypothetical protein
LRILQIRGNAFILNNKGPINMPEQTELPLTDFQLIYLNGQEHGGAPVFKDVRLDRNTHQVCEGLLSLAKDCDKRIRGDSELKRCLGIIKDLRLSVKQLEWLRQQERKPWLHILSQIDTAIIALQNQLKLAQNPLIGRGEAYRAEQEMGRAKQEEDLRREAAELEQKAKYASDPKEQRQASVQAKEKRQEAKVFKTLKPVAGMATVVVHEFEIENRLLAAKFPREAVLMECQDKWFNDKIKEAERNGQPMPTFPGIRVIVRTEVRVPR